MDYQRFDHASEIEIRLSGTFTFDDQMVARELMREVVADEKSSVTYNLAAMTAIDSSGIGLILMLNDRLGKAGKTFRITGATGVVADALRHAKIGEIIDVS